MKAAAPPRSRTVFGVAVLLLLAGSVLPWFRADEGVWAWDVSLAWSLTGNLELLRAPPSAGAAVLLAGLILAVVYLASDRIGGPVPAGAGAFVAGVCGVAVFRGLTYAANPLQPHLGLVACLAGGLLAAGAALAEGD